jgi:hypothetical protein
MTRSNLTALFVSLLIGLLCAGGLKAQEKPVQVAPHNLAIQIVGRHYGPSPVFEPPSEGGFMEAVAPPLSNWKQPAGTPPLARIRIRSKYEGAGVRLNVAAVFDDSEPVDAPGPKYGEKEEALGSYLVQEGETVTVRALARYGRAPMQLKIVKAAPRETESALSPQPVLENPLKSVVVVGFESDAQSAPFQRLLLRNLSAKSIIALDVYSELGHGSSNSQSMESTPGRPLIAPGATYEVRVSINGGRGGRTTPQGFVPYPPQPQTMVVGTVVFDDDTYEGEARRAAEIIARRRGRQLQLTRVLTLLPDNPDAPAQEPTDVLEKLKTQVSLLRIDADTALVDELAGRFPELPKGSRTLLAAEVMNGLKHGREEVSRRLKEMADAQTRNPQGFNLPQALHAFREHLEQLIAPR